MPIATAAPARATGSASAPIHAKAQREAPKTTAARVLRSIGASVRHRAIGVLALLSADVACRRSGGACGRGSSESALMAFVNAFLSVELCSDGGGSRLLHGVQLGLTLGVELEGARPIAMFERAGCLGL